MRGSNEIYVVDDDATVRNAIKSILRSAGYSLVAFSDGDSLLKAARRRQPLAFEIIEEPFSKKYLLERVEAAIDSRQPGRMIELRSDGPNPPLTAREVQVLEWLQTGETSKVIGKALKVSCRTVEYHRGNLLKTFGVNSVTRLLQVVMARRIPDHTSPRGRLSKEEKLDPAPSPS
jgi:FixJ family two-component response regulator